MGNVTAMDSDWRKNLRDAIARKGTNMRRVSLDAELGETYVRDMLERGRTPTIENAERIARALGVQSASIFGRDPSQLTKEPPKIVAAPETAPVPTNVYSPHTWPRDLRVLGMAECGPDGWSLWNGEVIEMTSRPPNLAGASQAYAVYIVGSSMEPRYFSGELAHINPGRPVSIGDFVLIQVRPEPGETTPRAVIKRLVKRSPTKVTLEQYNPAKTMEIRASEIISIHQIVGSGKP